MKKSLFSVIFLSHLALASVATAQIQITYSTVQPTCHGLTNGSATVFAVGGSGAYTYAWSTGQTTQTTFGIGTGFYTVTVSDAAFNTASETLTVLEPSAVAVSITGANLNCNGTSGTLTALGLGGTPPYTYSWAGGGGPAASNSIAVTAPGNYLVTVTDANNCSGVGMYTVPTTIKVQFVVQSATCPGINNATATAVVSPAGNGYIYQWNILPPDSNVVQVTGLAAGTLVSVTVTDPVSGCTATTSGIVGAHTSINVAVTDVDIPCAGGLGSATAVASNGTPQYQYTWFNNGVQIGNTSSIMGLNPGAYLVSVVDSVGCKAKAVADIGILSAPHALIDEGHVLVCGDSLTTVQFNNLSTDPYNVITMLVWHVTGPNLDTTINQQNQIVFQLPVDQTYIVQLIATSGMGCSDTATLAYNIPGYPIFTISLDSTTLACTSDSVHINVINGDSTYLYVWTPAVTLNPNPLHVLVSPVVPTLYVLTATDGNACTATDSITVGPADGSFDLFVSETNIQTCSNVATLFATTSVPTTIVWSQGGIPLVGNPVNVPATPVNTIYTVTAFASDSCFLSREVSVTGYNVDVNLDPTIGYTVCEVDSLPLSVVVTPSSGNLTYQWSVNAPATIINPSSPNPILTGPTGNYTVSVTVTNVICTDSLTFPVAITPSVNLIGNIAVHPCNGLMVRFFNDGEGGVWNFGDGSPLSNAIDPVHTYLQDGLYNVVFSPNIECAIKWKSTIYVQDTPLEANISTNYLDCSGQAEIQFNGTSNYPNSAINAWAWTFPNGIPVSATIQNPLITFSTEGTILATLVVKDINGCLDTISLPVEVHIINDTIPNALSICPGESVQLNPGGFDLGANYQWTAVPIDPTLDVNDPNPIVSPNVTTTYSLIISQGLVEQCSALYSTVVTVKDRNITLTNDQIVCSTDVITLTAQSNGAIGYEWSTSPNFIPIFGTTQTVNVTPPGTFYVRTTDVSCAAMDSVHIGLSLPEVQIFSENITCEGGFGNATAMATNGIPQYNYTWFGNGQFGDSSSISGLNPGTYTVVVVDLAGCTAEAKTNIALLSAPNAIIDGGHVLLCGDSFSTVQFINHSVDTYNEIATVEWIVTGASINTVIHQQDTITFQLPVDETITVQLISISGLGCADTTTIEYNVPGYPSILLSLDSTSIDCVGGPVSLNILGGNPTYTYVWDPTVTLNPDVEHVLVSPIVPTTYVLTATDGNACTATVSISVEPIDDPFQLTVLEHLIETCSDSVTLFASTNLPATILWSQGGIPLIGNPVKVPATSTTTIYTATALTAHNCLLTDEVSVTGIGVVVSLDPNAGTTICEGNSLPLSVIVTPLSGSLSYQWSVNTPGLINDPTAANPTLTGLAGTYTVRVIVVNGTNLMCADTLECPVEILPGSNLEGQISIDLCQGLSVHFLNNSISGGTWNFGDQSTSTEPNPTHVYGLPGSYHVVFTTNQQCVSPWDSTIEVHELPLAVNITNLYTDCTEQAQIQFNGNSNYPVTDIKLWAWTFSGGTPGNASVQNPILSFSTEGTILATLVVQDNNGCPDTVSLPVEVHIINDTIPNALAICPGESVQLNPGGFDLGANYLWTSVPPDPSLDVNDPTPVVTPTMPTTYSVVVTQGLVGQCSELYIVMVTFKPGGYVNLPNDTIVCANDLLTITAQSNGNVGYEWSNSPMFNPIFATTQTVQLSPNSTYYVRTTAECVDVDSMKIVLNPAEIQIFPTDLDICSGEEAALIVTNLIPGQDLTYVWTPSLPNDPNPIVSPTETTTYTVVATNQFGCTATLSFAVNVTTVSVNAEASPDTVSVSNPSTTLDAIPVGAVISYSWTPPGTLSDPNSAQTQATPTGTTVYIVTVTTQEGCVATDTVTIHYREQECASPFVFIPKAFTPNNDLLNDFFMVRADGMTTLKFIVWNRWGEIVYETEDPKALGWDGTYQGKASTPDSFSWYAMLTCGNGQIYKGKGNVTLLK